MDRKLLDILVCPLCKGPLVFLKDKQELICKGDRLAYPIRDGIPSKARRVHGAIGHPRNDALC